MYVTLNSFRRFWDLQGEMNRRLEEVLGGSPHRPQRKLAEVTQWAPDIDVAAKDGDLVIRAELPGVKQEDVDVTLQDDALTISGERKAEEEEQGGGYYVRERRYGSFSRSLPLPEGVDESKVHAR